MTAKEFTQKAMARAQTEQSKTEQVDDLETILFIIEGWKKKYCKVSQPNNYIRVTRIKPHIAGRDSPSSFWIQKLQLWIKGEIKYEYPIDSNTYSFISDLNDWEKTVESETFEKARWVNSKSKTL